MGNDESRSSATARTDAVADDGAATTTAVTDAGGLDVREVTVRFGGIVALDRADLTARVGEITGLIGPNGAGKTTLFNCLTGIYRAQSGSIRWQGDELLGMLPHQVAEQGISRTFQNLALFPRLTVRENVIVGLHRVRKTDWVSNAVRAPWVLSEERKVRGAGRRRAGGGRPVEGRRPPRRRPARTARSSASSWPAPWRPSRSCCCSTSRPPGSPTARSTT